MEQIALYQNKKFNMPRMKEGDFDHYVTIKINTAVNNNANPFQ